MRYVSINGPFRKMLVVVKMRRSRHSIDMCEYQITSKGVVIGDPLRGYRALTSGIPRPWSAASGQEIPEPRVEESDKGPRSKKGGVRNNRPVKRRKGGRRTK